MVIIQVEGGLGNQLFQYALYLSFKKKGIKSRLDITKFKRGNAHNGFELEKVFNPGEKYCSETGRKIIKSASKLLYLAAKHPYKESADWQWRYHPEVNRIHFGFLKGYWQTEKYFASAADLVKSKLIFPPLQDERNKETAQKAAITNSVSLHIRRGDYLIDGRNCSINADYYLNAIALMNEKISDPSFYIFSDDMEWAKKNIKEKEVYFIDWNKKDKSYIDMQLMSCCRHNIIGNSSFSWWGAWLNNNPQKIVIAPEKWMPHLNSDCDIIPGGWIKLHNSFPGSVK